MLDSTASFNALLDILKLVFGAVFGGAGVCIMQWWQRRVTNNTASKLEAEADKLAADVNMVHLTLIREQTAEIKKLLDRISDLEGKLLEFKLLQAKVTLLEAEVSQLREDLSASREELRLCEEFRKSSQARMVLP